MSHFLAALDCGLMGVPRPSIPLHCTAQGKEGGGEGWQQSAAASNTPQISIKRAHQKLPQLLSQVAASQAKVRHPLRATPILPTPHCHPLATLTNFCIKTLAQSFFLLLLLLLLLRALHGCSCNNFSTTNFLFVWLCCNYTQIERGGRGRKRGRAWAANGVFHFHFAASGFYCGQHVAHEKFLAFSFVVIRQRARERGKEHRGQGTGLRLAAMIFDDAVK